MSSSNPRTPTGAAAPGPLSSGGVTPRSRATSLASKTGGQPLRRMSTAGSSGGGGRPSLSGGGGGSLSGSKSQVVLPKSSAASVDSASTSGASHGGPKSVGGSTVGGKPAAAVTTPATTKQPILTGATKTPTTRARVSMEESNSHDDGGALRSTTVPMGPTQAQYDTLKYKLDVAVTEVQKQQTGVLEQQEAVQRKTMEGLFHQSMLEISYALNYRLSELVGSIRQDTTAGLEEELGNRDGEIAGLLLKTQTAMRELKEVQDENKRLEEAYTSTKDALENRDARLKWLEVNNQELVANLKKAESRVVELQDKLHSTEGEVDKQKVVIAELKINLSTVSSSHENLTSQVHGSDEKVLTLMSEVSALGARVQDLQQTADDERTQRRAMEARALEAEGKHEEMARRVSDAETAMKAAEDKLMLKVNETHTLNRDLDEIKQQKEDAKQKTQKKDLELQALHSRAAEHQQVVQRLEEERDAAVTERSTAVEQFAVAQERTRLLEGDLETARGDWATGMESQDWYTMASKESSAIILPLREAWSQHLQLVRRLRDQAAAAQKIAATVGRRRAASGNRAGRSSMASKQRGSPLGYTSPTLATQPPREGSPLGSPRLPGPDGGDSPANIKSPQTGALDNSGAAVLGLRAPSVQGADLTDSASIGYAPTDFDDLESHRGGAGALGNFSLADQSDLASRLGVGTTSGIPGGSDPLSQHINEVFKHLVAKDFELRRALVAKKKKNEELVEAEKVISEQMEIRNQQHEEWRNSLVRVVSQFSNFAGYSQLLDEVFSSKAMLAEAELIKAHAKETEERAEKYHARCSVLERHLEEILTQSLNPSKGGGGSSIAELLGGNAATDPLSPVNATTSQAILQRSKEVFRQDKPASELSSLPAAPLENSNAKKSDEMSSKTSPPKKKGLLGVGGKEVAEGSGKTVAGGASSFAGLETISPQSKKSEETSRLKVGLAATIAGKEKDDKQERRARWSSLKNTIQGATAKSEGTASVGRLYDPADVPTRSGSRPPPEKEKALLLRDLAGEGKFDSLKNQVQEMDSIRTHLLELEHSAENSSSVVFKDQMVLEMEHVHNTVTRAITPAAGATVSSSNLGSAGNKTPRGALFSSPGAAGAPAEAGGTYGASASVARSRSADRSTASGSSSLVAMSPAPLTPGRGGRALDAATPSSRRLTMNSPPPEATEQTLQERSKILAQAHEHLLAMEAKRQERKDIMKIKATQEKLLRK